MRYAIAALSVLLLAGCGSEAFESGEPVEGLDSATRETTVTLNDGTEIRCLVSRAYGGYESYDCDWSSND